MSKIIKVSYDTWYKLTVIKLKHHEETLSDTIDVLLGKYTNKPSIDIEFYDSNKRKEFKYNDDNNK